MQMGFSGTTQEWGRGTKVSSLKIDFPTMMKHHFHSADINSLSSEISSLCYINEYSFIFHFNTQLLILLTFFKILKLFQ